MMGLGSSTHDQWGDRHGNNELAVYNRDFITPSTMRQFINSFRWWRMVSVITQTEKACLTGVTYPTDNGKANV